jgi:transcription elongation GreA/GreB family factor
MSVAFRRESDEEHKEPRFELPIPPGPNLVTPRGLALIEARVAELERRPDPDEDSKRNLRYWRQRLATAQLVETASRDEVGFGSRVTFRLNGRERTAQIVGDDEADPAAGLIALSAPLAQALLGASEDEQVAFGGQEDAIVVLAID